MTDTTNRTHTGYYGFDFYIEERGDSIPATETYQKLPKREVAKPEQFVTEGKGTRLVFVSKSGRAFSERVAS